MDINTAMELVQNERSTTEVYDEIKIIKDSLNKLLRKAVALRKAKVGCTYSKDVFFVRQSSYKLKINLQNNHLEIMKNISTGIFNIKLG